MKFFLNAILNWVIKSVKSNLSEYNVKQIPYQSKPMNLYERDTCGTFENNFYDEVMYT